MNAHQSLLFKSLASVGDLYARDECGVELYLFTKLCSLAMNRPVLFFVKYRNNTRF